MVMSVWDDGYGISVPREHQTTKDSISEALAGMQRTKDKPGYEIFVTKGWDYAHLCETYEKAVALARAEHIPVLIHVKEVNQPQGHSTSGSHERYKDEARLKWEVEFDCIAKFKEWILNFDADGLSIATEAELEEIEKASKTSVRDQKNAAWSAFLNDMKEDHATAVSLLKALASESENGVFINKLAEELEKAMDPIRKDILSTARKALRIARSENLNSKNFKLKFFLLIHNFILNKSSTALTPSSYRPGITSVNLNELFPKKISRALREGLQLMEKKIPGFTKHALLVAPETRTSSPVRIPRDKHSLQHIDIVNMFPCGEGAGYAGGIISAAIDGEKCALKIKDSL